MWKKISTTLAALAVLWTALPKQVEGGNFYYLDSSYPRKFKSASIENKLRPQESDTLTIATRASYEGIALDYAGEKMYYWQAGQYPTSLKRVDLNGENEASLFTVVEDVGRGLCLDVDNDRMYWLEAVTGLNRWGNKTNVAYDIKRFDISGTDTTTVATVSIRASQLVLDAANQKLYWYDSEWPNNTLKRIDVDGRNEESLFNPGYTYALDFANQKIYWASGWPAEIKRANLDSTDLETVLKLDSGNINKLFIDSDDEKIYWTDYAILKRVDFDGANAERVYVALEDAHSARILFSPNSSEDSEPKQLFYTRREKITRGNLAYDLMPVVEDLTEVELTDAQYIFVDHNGEKVYWSTSSHIMRADLDGENADTLAAIATNGWAVDIEGEKIYWAKWIGGWSSANPNTGIIKSIDFYGTEEMDLVSDIHANTRFVGLDAANQKLHWRDYNSQIRRADTDGRNTEDLISAQGVSRIDFDNQKIYWYSYQDKAFFRANLDSTDVETLFNLSDESRVSDIFLNRSKSENKIYWIEETRGGAIERLQQAMRANLDGSNIELIEFSSLELRELQLSFVPNLGPVLSNLTESVTFPQNSVTNAPRLIGNEATVEDEDTPYFDGGTLTVTYASRDKLGNHLSILSGGQVTSVDSTISYGGEVIGTQPASGEGSGLNDEDLVITFNAAATPERVEAVIENLAFRNSSLSPGASRTISFKVSDGTGGTSGSVEVVIELIPNLPPVLSSSVDSVIFNENLVNAAPQLFNGEVTIEDEDSPDFGGGKVTVSYVGDQGQSQDQLSILDLGRGAERIGFADGNVAYGGILIGTVPVEGAGSGQSGRKLEATLNASATPASVTALIENLVYGNSSDEPNPSRMISITIADGDGGVSDAILIDVNVIAEIEGTIVRIIDTYAGGGSVTEEGAQAFESKLSFPFDAVVGPDGLLYIVDTNNQRICRVAEDGTMTTVVGSGTRGFGGDGGPATEAMLASPRSIFITAKGEIYISDTNNHRIRKVDVDGNITTVAGTGEKGFSADRGRALTTNLNSPWGVTVAPSGAIYISDTNNDRILLVRNDGRVVSIAGTGARGYSGDNGPATEAQLSSPGGIALNPQGEVYITDTNNHRIRKIGLNGKISTVAGTGVRGFGGDGGPAAEAMLASPRDLIFSATGDLYVADTFNSRIRKIEPNGDISTACGTGSMGTGGDLGPATDAQLSFPFGIAISPDEEMYVVDTFNEKIRKGFEILVPPGMSPLLVQAKRVVPMLMPTRGVGIDAEGWLIRGLFGQDAVVGMDDFFLFVDHFGTRYSDGGFDPLYDMNGSGMVDMDDMFLFTDEFGRRSVTEADLAGFGASVLPVVPVSGAVRTLIDEKQQAPVEARSRMPANENPKTVGVSKQR